MKRVVYWDSDVFLRLINAEKDRAFEADGESAQKILHGCQDVWANCEKGLMHITTSALTIAEVIHKSGTPKLNPQHRVLLSNFFRQDFLSIKPLTREVGELARDVVWDNAIKAKDAVHVATCAYFKIAELHSVDLSRHGSLLVNGFAVQIVTPSARQGELPFR